MSEQIATNSESVTEVDSVTFALQRDEYDRDWTITVTKWSDGTHTVDACSYIDPWPVQMRPIPDDYEIDLGTDVPTIERVVDALERAIEYRTDDAWETYLSNYYGG
jgi:hypothetical protein